MKLLWHQQLSHHSTSTFGPNTPYTINLEDQITMVANIANKVKLDANQVTKQTAKVKLFIKMAEQNLEDQEEHIGKHAQALTIRETSLIAE